MLAGGSAQAATSVTAEAAVSPGQPAGYALRLAVRIADDAAPAPDDGPCRLVRLTGVTPGAVVSVRCLHRCGGRGGELKKSVRGGTVRLKRPLRPRSRFELRVGEPGLVARLARYRVDRRGRTQTLAGCRDASGAKRACPAG